MDTIKIDNRYKSIKSLVKNTNLKRSISIKKSKFMNQSANTINTSIYNINDKVNNLKLNYIRKSIKRNIYNFESNIRSKYNINSNVCPYERNTNFKLLKDNCLKYNFYKKRKSNLDEKVKKIKSILNRRYL